MADGDTATESETITDLTTEDLGEMYVDTVTGFQGVATSKIDDLHSPQQVFLENDSTHRWVPTSRLQLVGSEDQPI